MTGRVYRMERDRARFKEVVRGKIRQDLRKYLSSSELVGKQGDKVVSIPVPSIELPRFRFGSNEGGVGQGDGAEGDPVQGQPGDGEGGAGGAGEAEGQHVLEAEVELDELAAMLGEELELPRIEQRGRDELMVEGGKWSGVRSQGPQSLRHFRRTFRRALVRTIASGAFDPKNPVVIPIRDDERFRARKPAPVPDSSAVIFHMMDVSGSMGREQKDIVRIEAFWIDTWAAKPVRVDRSRLHRFTTPLQKVVDKDTFLPLARVGWHQDLLRVRAGAGLDAVALPARGLQTSTPSTTRTATIGVRGEHGALRDARAGRDPAARQPVLLRAGQERVRLGPVQERPRPRLRREDRIVTSSVSDRSGIPDAIKAFLGQGR